MPVPIKFTADMTAVRQAIDSIIADTSTRDAVINVRGGGGGGGAADPLLAQASALANKYAGQFSRAPVRMLQNTLGVDLPRAGALAAAVQANAVLGGSSAPALAASPGGSGAFSQTMTTGQAYGGAIASSMAGSGGFFTQGWPGNVGNWAQPAPTAGPSPSTSPGGARFWSAVAALGQPATPAGFWGGAGGGALTPPPYRPPAPPAPPPTPQGEMNRYAQYRAFGALTAVVAEAGRFGEAYQQYDRELDLAAAGPRRGVDLMRQYKAQVGFADAIENSNPFSKLGGVIREWGTANITGTEGDRHYGARVIQEAEQGEQRADLRHGVAVANKAMDLQTYVTEARGGHEQLLRSAEVQLWNQQQQSWDRRQAMVRAGDTESAADKYYNEADAYARRQYGKSVERIDRVWNNQGDRMVAGMRSDRLRGMGYDERATANDIEADYNERAENEEDPQRAALIRQAGGTAVASFRARTARARDYSAQDTRASANLIRMSLRDDPVSQSIQEAKDERDRGIRNAGKEITDDQRQAFEEQFRARRDVILRDDRRARGNEAEDIANEGAALGMEVAGRQGSASSIRSAGSYLGAARARRQRGDDDNADALLQNGILAQMALRKQVFESFEAKEVDPTLTAFGGPRSGEDVGSKLDTIATEIRRLKDAMVPPGSTNAGGAQTSP